MPVSHSIEHEEHTARRQSSELDAVQGHESGREEAPESANYLSTSLLGDHRLALRGNSTARSTLMLQAQQIYGNQAVRRALQRVQAYCVKDRTMVSMKDPKQIKLKNGRCATQGTCPKCGTKVTRIGC